MAVGAHAKSLGCKKFICCGDSIGLGPSPNEVLDWLRKKEVPTVRGNVDYNIARIVKRQKRYIRKGKFEKYVSYGHTWNVLSDVNRKFLKSMPERVEQKVGGLEILAVHGLPHDVDGGLHSGLARRDGDRMLKTLGCQVLAAGHIHQPFVEERPLGLLLNCGSVGCYGASPPTATYVLLTIKEGKASGRVYWVTYDNRSLYLAYEKAGLPRELADFYCEGRLPTSKERRLLSSHCESGVYRAR